MKLEDRVKMLLGISISDTKKTYLIEYLVQRVQKRVLTYCNLRELPKALEELVVEMCVTAYRDLQFGQEEIAEVKSISKGDTSHSFKTTSEVIRTMIDKPSFISDYTSELSAFRKLRW